jgi:hypothetical protein
LPADAKRRCDSRAGSRGCGPTPDERYLTAQYVLNAELRRLDELEAATDAAYSRCVADVVKARSGYTAAESRRKVGELNDQAMEVFESAQRGHWLVETAGGSPDWTATNAKIKAVQDEADAILSKMEACLDECEQPGTAAHYAVQSAYERTPEFVAWEEQQARVDDAQREIDRLAEERLRNATP